MHRPISAFVMISAGLVLAFVVLPNLIIIPISFSPTEIYQFPPQELSLRWYERFFSDPRWIEALLRSLRIGVLSAAFSVVLGTCAAFGLTRGRLFGMQAASALLLAPLIVPHVIYAAGLYVFYANVGVLQTEAGIVVAHTMLGTPIVAVTVMAALHSLRRDLELAAMSLGANYTVTFFRVTLPQIMPGIVTGAIFAFVASFDEVTVAIFISGVRSITMPVKMWEGITVESNPVLPAASTILLIGSTIPVVIIEIHRRLRERRKVVS
jgi:ABC-type spermidine/putrescine transport system permease subunit II